MLLAIDSMHVTVTLPSSRPSRPATMRSTAAVSASRTRGQILGMTVSEDSWRIHSGEEQDYVHAHRLHRGSERLGWLAAAAPRLWRTDRARRPLARRYWTSAHRHSGHLSRKGA